MRHDLRVVQQIAVGPHSPCIYHRRSPKSSLDAIEVILNVGQKRVFSRLRVSVVVPGIGRKYTLVKWVPAGGATRLVFEIEGGGKITWQEALYQANYLVRLVRDRSAVHRVCAVFVGEEVVRTANHVVVANQAVVLEKIGIRDGALRSLRHGEHFPVVVQVPESGGIYSV